jgi:hypothetical protein
MAVDSFSHSSSNVLNDIDPLSRALLDLSIQRGMDDEEIADVLGTDTASVFEVRVGLLRNLADQVAPEHAEADERELQAVVAERLYAEPADLEPTDVQPGDLEAVDSESADLEPANDSLADAQEPALTDPGSLHDPEPLATTDADWPDQPDEQRPDAGSSLDAEAFEPELATVQPAAPPPAAAPRRRRSPLVVLVPLLLLALIAAAVVALTSGTSGDGDERSTAPAPAPRQPAAEPREQPSSPEPARRSARLEAVGATGARGTASIRDGRLRLSARGLADPAGGAYQVWLYDSIIDARSIGSSERTTIDLTAKLPAGASRYEWVDVSLEPADGNPNHSGQSVLRVPLKKLR